LSKGDEVKAEWDYDRAETARTESNGQRYTHLAFIDAFGGEHPAPYPGMRETGLLLRRLRRLPREYKPVKPGVTDPV
jgi:hypothetical protein